MGARQRWNSGNCCEIRAWWLARGGRWQCTPCAPTKSMQSCLPRPMRGAHAPHFKARANAGGFAGGLLYIGPGAPMTQSTEGRPNNGRKSPAWHPRRASGRLLGSLAAGLAAAALVPAGIHWQFRGLVAWDVGSLVLLALAWFQIARADADQTRIRAAADDPGRNMVLVIALCSSVYSLFAALVVLRRARALGAVPRSRTRARRGGRDAPGLARLRDDEAHVRRWLCGRERSWIPPESRGTRASTCRTTALCATRCHKGKAGASESLPGAPRQARPARALFWRLDTAPSQTIERAIRKVIRAPLHDAQSTVSAE